MVSARTTAVALAIATSPVAAQSGLSQADMEGSLPAWATAWSPFAPLADHPRLLPGAPALPGLLHAPAPRVGLFWSAGTPGALAVEATDSWASAQLIGTGDNGTYRRPLDRGDVTSGSLIATGWRPLGARAAAAGRVVAGQQSAGSGSFADVAEPYATSPLVPTDTSSPAMRRVHARLEGAFGMRFGDFGAGVATGLEVRDDRTVRARFPRLARSASPALTASVSYGLPFAGARAAAYGRWVEVNETLTLVPRPAPGLVHQLDGYSDPDPREVAFPNTYFRRIERTARGFGLGVSGELLRATWVVHAERTRRTDRHFTERSEDPPADGWTASGWALGAAAQRAFRGGRILLTAQARYSHLEGDATRFDIPGVIFRAHESAFDGRLEARYSPPSPWQFAGAFTLSRGWRQRRDFLAEVGSHIVGWEPGVALEVARVFGGRSAVSVGAAAALYSAVSTLPLPESMGEVYQRVIAPELSLLASQATSTAGALSFRHRFGEELHMTAAVSLRSVAPRPEGMPLPLVPAGNRTIWSASLGLILSP